MVLKIRGLSSAITSIIALRIAFSYTKSFVQRLAARQEGLAHHTHHVQRLMVIGNFALIADLNPDEVN